MTVVGGREMSPCRISVENLDLAGRLVDVCQSNDQLRSDLHEKLRLSPRIDIPTFSGLGDPHYVCLDNIGLDGAAEYAAGARHPIPQELLDQFLHMQCNCCMGLFPEISRAWVSVDSDIFIWNYDTGTDLAYFDGLPNTVLSVGLVRPKSGLFQPHIQYLLCVATAVDIVLLAVNFSDSTGNSALNNEELRTAEMHLLPDPLFKVPLDGAVISDICCCRNGRIFLGSRDGCLYELDYGDRGWFKKQCKKINHSKGVMSYLVPSFVSFVFGSDEPLIQVAVDETRHILFTLSEGGSIQVFDLGSDGEHASKVTSLSASAIEHYACAIVQTIEPSNFRPCVHISAIRSSESAVLNLVAVTHSGIRFYFSCYYPDHSGGMSQPSGSPKSQDASRPLTLRLLHVRLPPGFTAGTMVARPQNAHLSWAQKESFVFACAVNEESDVIWGFSCSNFPCQFEMVESVSQLPIRGRTWAVKSVDSTVSDYFDDIWQKQFPKSVLPVRPSNTVVQHILGVEKIIVLTAQGVHHIEKLRPVDLLRHLLEEFGPDSQEVKSFFQLHQADQASEMCVILACSSSAHDHYNVREKAVRAMFTFGGDPQMTFPSERNFSSAVRTQTPGVNASMADWSHLPGSPVQASTPQSPFRPLHNLSSQYAGTFYQGPVPLTSTVIQTPAPAEHTPPVQPPHPEIKYSSRHNGLYLRFARILGSLWNMHMVLALPHGKGNFPLLNSALTSEELTWFLDQLKRLKEFFDQHSLLPSAMPVGGLVSSGQPSSSFDGRGNLHHRMLNFMRPETIDSVGHARQQLSRKNRAEAVSGERQSLIRLYEMVERSCEVLELWKILADHNFGLLVSQLPPDIREMLESVTLRQLIISGKELCADLITCLIRYHLSDDTTTDEISTRLRRVCPTFYTSDDATAAKASELLQLARNLEEGQKRDDVLQEALRLYKKVAKQLHIPTVCIQLQEALFFDGIVDLALCAAEKSDPQGLALAYYKNRGLQGEDNSQLKHSYLNRLSYYACITEQLDKLNSGNRDPRVTSQMAEMLAEEMVRKVLNSDDELCHVAVYEWMIERNLTGKLLHINSPYLENYLQSKVCESGPLTDGLLDLLWQFYEKESRFIQAAQLLSKLAERHSTKIDLSRRLTYLSRAVMCAKSAPGIDGDRGSFLQELEDKLEVARLQVQVLDCLKQLKIRPAYVKDAISRLNANLMDVTQLYGDYADQFSLPECKLAIVHCAGHCDADLIQTLWKEIVEKELTLSQDDSPDTRMKRMETKLACLSRLYSSTPRYFPVEFLLKMLQLKSFENEFLPEWVAKVIERMGIGAVQTLDLLDHMYKQRQSIWRTNSRAQTHLLTTVLSVINEFAERSTTFALDEKRKVAAKCMDEISFFLIELQAAPGRDMAALRQSFQAVELKIQRII